MSISPSPPRYPDTVASPAELVLHYHCLNISCVGLHGDISIGAAIYPSDTKYLSGAMLVEFLQGLQMTSICNPYLALVRECTRTSRVVLDMLMSGGPSSFPRAGWYMILGFLMLMESPRL